MFNKIKISKLERKNWFVIFALFCVYLFLLPRHFHDYDMGLFKLWAIQNFKFGVGNAYKISNNYLPLYQYILYFFAFIQGNVANVEKNLY